MQNTITVQAIRNISTKLGLVLRAGTVVTAEVRRNCLNGRVEGYAVLSPITGFTSVLPVHLLRQV